MEIKPRCCCVYAEEQLSICHEGDRGEWGVAMLLAAWLGDSLTDMRGQS
jgi:hypothetical protein